ncbi:MAG: hypothetical protein JW881_18890 [Spirochaetales bacterium]|nr:hypothetical protein [Spirochaetales bacterium]
MKKEWLFQGIIPQVISFVFVLLFLIGIIFAPADETRTLWKGYYTLVLDTPGEIAPVCERLARVPGITGVVSKDTSRVTFNNLETLEEITVSELESRLDPLDPRNDAYMKSLHRYFLNSDGCGVIYVKTRLNRVLFSLTAGGIVNTRSITMSSPDVRLHEQFLYFFFALIFAVCFIFFRERKSPHKAPAILGLFPWLMFTLSGDMVSLVCFFIIYPAWFRFYRESSLAIDNRILYQWDMGTNGRFIKSGLIAGGALFSAFVIRLLQGGGAGLFSLLFVAFASASLSVFTLLFRLRKETQREHRLFTPVRLFPLSRKSFNKGITNGFHFHGETMAADAALLAIVACCFILMYVVMGGSSDTGLPLPLRQDGSDAISYQGLIELEKTKRREYLPDLSDYVSHRFYQEGISDGAVYGFPALHEEILTGEYREESGDGSIVQTLKTRHTCDEAWLDAVIGSIKENSIEELLFLQQRPLHVSAGSAGDYYLVGYPVFSSILIFSIVYLFIFFGDFHLTASRLYGTTSFTGRRTQKAA